jgi:uncharacterized spore protein YtfJ
MGMDEIVAAARDAFSSRLVFAEPFTRDGMTIIPAARVSGGGGGGGGRDREEGQEGSGGGFGLHARPSGAYVMKNGAVRWMPAVDPNRVITVIGAVVIAALLTRARMEKLRATVAAQLTD